VDAVVRTPYSVRPAPRPLGAAPTVQLDEGWQRCVARRRERLAGEPDRVRVRWQGAPADADGLSRALMAAATVVRAAGIGLGPVDRADVAAVSDAVGLAQPADLVVLRRVGPGRLRAEWLAVALPSHWDPVSRAGAALEDLHAPVGGNARLQAAAPALSEALLTKGPFVQTVWGLQPDDRLDHDPGSALVAPEATDWPTDPGRWYLRWERQVSTPLPELDRALFWIRPYLRRLEELDVTHRRELAAAVDSMGAESLRYKRLAGVRARLRAWAGAPVPATGVNRG
jgi:hypothetical protein